METEVALAPQVWRLLPGCYSVMTARARTDRASEAPEKASFGVVLGRIVQEAVTVPGRHSRPTAHPTSSPVRRGKRDTEPLLVHRTVMAPAQQHQIVERRRAAVGPVPQVVGIAAAVVAPGELALAVTGNQRPAESSGVLSSRSRDADQGRNFRA